MENLQVTIIDRGEKKSAQMPVSEEVPLTIEVNGRELATFLCSPEHLKNLVTGFLFTIGDPVEGSPMPDAGFSRNRRSDQSGC
jgi:FdhD protein